VHRSRPRPLLLACATPLLLVATGGAQVRAAHAQEPVRGWELPWLDISPNGGWRVRARAVAAARARLLAQRRFPALNAPVAPGVVNATAVTGTLRVPVVMFRYKNSAPAQYARDTAQYNATLFGVVPPNGKPYTLRSFYEQMANGQFSIQGRSVGWVALDSNEVTYTGVPGTCPANPYGTNCNGVWSGTAFSAMQRGLREALAKVDAQVDFAQYDDDGDGVVDAVLFLHPSMDGACTFDASNNHLWSHRDRLQSTGAAYVTNDPRPGGGGNEVVNDYILQSSLGSAAGGVCDSTAIMPIGTAAHELGHILALPDLYDVFGSSEGIGEWGLMGSGNYAKPESPSWPTRSSWPTSRETIRATSSS
jgi:immune inhibitor A